MKDYTINNKRSDEFILNYRRVNGTLVVDSKEKEKSIKRSMLFSKGSIVLCIDARIAEGLQPFNLNTADYSNLDDLKKIKQNLELNKYFGFTYHDKTKQKTR